MNRTDSLERWRRVAAGDLDRDQYDAVDLHAWIREVAAKVLAADGETAPNARPWGMLGAVGLAGKVDGYAELRALIAEPQWDFHALAEDGGALPATRGELVREIVDEARRRGLLAGVYEVDDTKARDLVRGLLPKRI